MRHKRRDRRSRIGVGAGNWFFSLSNLPTLACGGGGTTKWWKGGRRAKRAHAANNGQPTKGRPFYGQAKGQLRLTWRSYAGPPQHINSSPPKGETTHYILRVASAQGAADWRSGPRWSILSVLCPVHPFPLRGISPQGETRK